MTAFGFSPSAERAETRDGGWKLDTAGDFEGRTMEQARVTVNIPCICFYTGTVPSIMTFWCGCSKNRGRFMIHPTWRQTSPQTLIISAAQVL